MNVQQPRPYRIRVYDQGAEVLTERRFLAPLDLTPGPGLLATRGQLDALLLSLAYADGVRGDRVRGYSLRVEDWNTGDVICDWPATSWPE